VAFAVIEIMCTATPLVVFVAVSVAAFVVSAGAAPDAVSPALAAGTTLTSIVCVTPSDVAETVVVPIVSPVINPLLETSATSCDATDHVTGAVVMTAPR
jgi:hypothetical protein